MAPNDKHLPRKIFGTAPTPDEARKLKDDFEPFQPDGALTDVKPEVGAAVEYFLKASRKAGISQSVILTRVEGDDIHVGIKGGIPDLGLIKTLLSSLGTVERDKDEVITRDGNTVTIPRFVIRPADALKVTQLTSNVETAKTLTAKLELLQTQLGIEAPTVKAREDGTQPAFMIEVDYTPQHNDAAKRQSLGRALHARLMGGAYDHATNRINDDCQKALQQRMARKHNEDWSVYTYPLEIDARRPDAAQQFQSVLSKELLVPLTQKFEKLMKDANVPARKIELSLDTTTEVPYAKFVIVGGEERAQGIVAALSAIGLSSRIFADGNFHGVKCTFKVPAGASIPATIDGALDKVAQTLASNPGKYAVPSPRQK